MGVPPNHLFIGIFHYKPTILGSPFYGNPHIVFVPFNSPFIVDLPLPCLIAGGYRALWV
jgi:hypothetical protein